MIIGPKTLICEIKEFHIKRQHILRSSLPFMVLFFFSLHLVIFKNWNFIGVSQREIGTECWK